jgi:hypothetical protein
VVGFGLRMSRIAAKDSFAATRLVSPNHQPRPVAVATFCRRYAAGMRQVCYCPNMGSAAEAEKEGR